MIVDYTRVKHIYLVCGKTDMRKSIDGLAALVQDQFDMDVFDDCLFLFCGGGRNKYKALHWDGNVINLRVLTNKGPGKMREAFSHFPLSLSFLTIEGTTKQGSSMKKVALIPSFPDYYNVVLYKPIPPVFFINHVIILSGIQVNMCNDKIVWICSPGSSF